MIFWIHGDFNFGPNSFADILARKLNEGPPAWPLSDADTREWEELLAGWPEANPGFIRRSWSVNVDRILALVAFRHRAEISPPPDPNRESRQKFEAWRNQSCLLALEHHLSEVFGVLRQLIESVNHPVVCGSQLGAVPIGNPFTRMLSFQYRDIPRLPLVFRRAPGPDAGAPANMIEVGERLHSREEVLEGIAKTSEGISLCPSLENAVIARG